MPKVRPRTLIGRVEAIFRDPVKAMRGEPLEAAALGWHNDSHAGIYATVTRIGRLAVGQTIVLHG